MGNTVLVSCRVLCRLMLCLATLAFGSAALRAQPEQGSNTTLPVRQAERPAPGLTPDRIVMTFCGDPSTSRAVTWRTSTEITQGFAEITLAETGQRFYQEKNGHEYKQITFENNVQRVKASRMLFDALPPKCHYHHARFEGLQPSTRYVYRVGDGTNWSEWFQFRTASRDAEPFRFIYLGDAQDSIGPMWSWVFRAAYAAAPDAAFIIHGGDLTAQRDNDGEWADWVAAGGWVNAMMPAVPTAGNHEYYKTQPNGRPGRHIEHHWLAQFTLPDNGPMGLQRMVYYFDYQGVRVISLNGNERLEEQAEWLRGLCEKNTNVWTIVTFHQPIYDVANVRSSGTRPVWGAVLDQCNVDLVLTGHDHVYSRSGLISGQTPTTMPGGRGAVYVVSVSGPKMNKLGAAKDEPAGFAKREAEDTQFFQIISVDGRTLQYEAWTATGVLYDAFTLTKKSDGAKELIERIPETPARRRGQPGSSSGPDRGAVLVEETGHSEE